jgi:predicted transcriptional regulator of viral defense system
MIVLNSMPQADSSRKSSRSSLLRTAQVQGSKSRLRVLKRLQKRGAIERVAKGIWRDLSVETSQFHSFVEPAFRSPQGVICLLSALSFHNLTTQQPAWVWFAIGQDTKPPKTAEIALEVVRMSKVCLEEGIEVQTIEGVPVRITSAARTVADCFKFRNKVGLDVAIEALRDCLKKRQATATEIHHYAQICRVAKVMQPYLETILELI